MFTFVACWELSSKRIDSPCDFYYMQVLAAGRVASVSLIRYCATVAVADLMPGGWCCVLCPGVCVYLEREASRV